MRRADIALVAAVAVVFAPALHAMARVWTSLDYYSHGFLVPVVAWWIFAAKRKQLGPPLHDWRGLAAIAVSALALGLGFVTSSPTWMGLAWVGAVCGLVLHLWGPAGLKLQAFPLAFLLFMVPLPAALLNPIIVRLQLWASAAGVDALQLLGYSVLREGNVMLLPGGDRLFVDEACSGITSIVTLLPLGTVLAYLGERSALRRTLIVLAILPIAMFGNFLRVVLTVAGAERFGSERVLAGPLHESAGLLTFLFACALLIGLRVLLRALPERRPARA
jgi:exosortase